MCTAWVSNIFIPVCFYPCQVAEHDESKVFMTIHTKKAAQSQVVDCTFIFKKKPPPPAKGCFIITCFSDGSSGARGLVIVGGFKSTTSVNLRVEGSVKTIFEGTIPLLDKGSLPPPPRSMQQAFPEIAIINGSFQNKVLVDGRRWRHFL